MNTDPESRPRIPRGQPRMVAAAPARSLTAALAQAWEDIVPRIRCDTCTPGQMCGDCDRAYQTMTQAIHNLRQAEREAKRDPT